MRHVASFYGNPILDGKWMQSKSGACMAEEEGFEPPNEFPR